MQHARKLVAFLAFATLTACAGATTGPDANTNGASIAGTYTLRTLDGQSLPYVIQSGVNKMTITRAVLTMTDGGTWSETDTYLLSTQGGPAQEQVVAGHGTYSRVGSTIALYDAAARDTYTATFSANTLTFDDTRVYTR